MNYKLVVTEKQVGVISRACELFSRIQMGQLNAVAFQALMGTVEDTERFCKLRDGLEELQPLVWGFRHGGPGIFSDKLPDEARIAWDVNQTLRRMLAYRRNPEGGWTVDFDTPMKSSRTEPLPEIVPTEDQPDPRPVGLRMAEELQELIGTGDFQEALERVKKWKEDSERLEDLKK